MDDFKKFLSEQSDEQPYKILVISAEPTKEKMFHTAQRVTDEAKKLGHDVYVVKVEGAIVSYENEWRIYNSDDKKLVDALDNEKSTVKRISYGIENKNKNLINNKKNILSNKKKTIMINTEELALKGRHNLLNAMAALTVSDLLKIENEIIRESLLGFSGLPHRLENFLRIQGVNYINDSKATNVNAAYYALDSMTSPTVWIAGGVDKGNDYSELLPIVREKVKAIICLGIDNTKLLETFKPISEIIVETESIDEAVKIASKIAEKKDNVLLSPACASFDLFESYEDRGNQFKQAVRNL